MKTMAVVTKENFLCLIMNASILMNGNIKLQMTIAQRYQPSRPPHNAVDQLNFVAPAFILIEKNSGRKIALIATITKSNREKLRRK